MDRIYVIKDLQTGEEKLAAASNQAQATQLVVGARFETRVANTLEVAKMVAAGVSVLEAPKKAPKDPMVDFASPPGVSEAKPSNPAADPENAPWNTPPQEFTPPPPNLHIGNGAAS